MVTKKFLLYEELNAPKICNASTVKVKRKNKSDLGESFIAPDGGWGWIVCIAVGFSNMVANAGLQQFGLIYRKNLATLDISNTQISSLINTQLALAAFTGLFNGPLFCRFTLREVGLAGSSLIFTGLLLSAWSTNFIQYILTFGILYGIGYGLTLSSSSLALNTYFKDNLRKATSLSFTIAGIGLLVLPFVVVSAIVHLGYIGAVIILAVISLISFFSAICYRPALQFSKGTQKTTGAEELQKEKEVLLESKSNEIQKLGPIEKFMKELDLALLKDKTFLNLLIGLTIILFAEMNFFVLVPFILGEAGFSDQHISLAMSVAAGVDILTRFLSSFVTPKLSVGNKALFAVGIISVSIGRFIVVFTGNFNFIIFAFTLLGFGRAIRITNRPLIIAGYVPLKRLPAARGLQLVSTCIFSLSMGPLFGVIMQNWGYGAVVHILNIMAILGLLSWGIEGLCRRNILKNEELTKLLTDT